ELAAGPPADGRQPTAAVPVPAEDLILTARTEGAYVDVVTGRPRRGSAGGGAGFPISPDEGPKTCPSARTPRDAPPVGLSGRSTRGGGEFSVSGCCGNAGYPLAWDPTATGGQRPAEGDRTLRPSPRARTRYRTDEGGRSRPCRSFGKVPSTSTRRSRR